MGSMRFLFAHESIVPSHQNISFASQHDLSVWQRERNLLTADLVGALVAATQTGSPNHGSIGVEIVGVFQRLAQNFRRM